MSFLEPLGSFFGFELEVVFASADGDLQGFHQDGMSFAFGTPLLFVLIILELTIIHYFCNWWNGSARYFNKIKAGGKGLFKSLFKRDNTEVVSSLVNYSKLRRSNLMIYSSSLCTQFFLWY